MALVCVADYEKEAFKNLPRNALDYYRSGAGDEFSLSLNIQAYKRLRILPRFLRDVFEVTTKCTAFGCELQTPIGVAPTAMQKMANEDGEIATARAAGKIGAVFVLSTLSTTSMEDIAEAAPDTVKWFQLYIYKDRRISESMVRRAELAGFKALVLTIDAPYFGQRRADARNKFQLPSHLRLQNFEGELATGVQSQGASAINEYVAKMFDARITWKDVGWLVNLSKLPVVVKGVLTSEDAMLAHDYGCKGVIVSNHGARQLDTVPAPIEVLPQIVNAVGKKMIVMMDGGVRQGTDVFKAIALGARIVFMGRPLLWGLAVKGAIGAQHVLELVQQDLKLTMQLSGCVELEDITKDFILHESELSKL